MTATAREEKSLPWERRALGIIRRRIEQATFRSLGADLVSIETACKAACIRVCHRAIQHGIMEPPELTDTNDEKVRG